MQRASRSRTGALRNLSRPPALVWVGSCCPPPGFRLFGCLAGRTHPYELQVVTVECETVLLGHRLLEHLDCGVGELDSLSAFRTDEVVVMISSPDMLVSLGGLGAKVIGSADDPRFDHERDVPVDGRHGDWAFLFSGFRRELLWGPVRIHLA